MVHGCYSCGLRRNNKHLVMTAQIGLYLKRYQKKLIEMEFMVWVTIGFIILVILIIIYSLFFYTDH